MIDVHKAVEETLKVARNHNLDAMSSDNINSDYAHLKFMQERMITIAFSEAKLNRWLGWIQACVFINSMGEITLDDLKKINKGAST